MIEADYINRYVPEFVQAAVKRFYGPNATQADAFVFTGFVAGSGLLLCQKLIKQYSFKQIDRRFMFDGLDTCTANLKAIRQLCDEKGFADAALLAEAAIGSVEAHFAEGAALVVDRIARLPQMPEGLPHD